MPSTAEQKKLKELQDTFALFDKDHDGVVTAQELGNMVRSLGKVVTEAEIKQLIQQAGGGDVGLKFDQFSKLMASKESQSVGEMEQELLDAFKAFDTDKDGFITVLELKNMLCNMGEKMSDAEVNVMISEVDKKNEGKIDYSAFLKVMMKE